MIKLRPATDRPLMSDEVKILIEVSEAAKGPGCFCGIAIGDPRIKSHSKACQRLIDALEAVTFI